MVIPSLFQTIAEISIGLAGFSGLVVTLRRNTGPLSEIQKYRLRVLFAMAFGAMFLALLPDLLANFQVPDDRIWFDSSAVLFSYSLLFIWWWVGPSKKIARVAPEIFNWRAFNTMAGGHVIVLLLQLAVLIGFFEPQAMGVFGLGLIWYLVHATQQFVRMLFIQPKTETESETESGADREST